jgi:hypothetical protein
VAVATLCVVCDCTYDNRVKGGGRAPQPSPAWANFFIIMECMPENGRCPLCVYSLGAAIEECTKHARIRIGMHSAQQWAEREVYSRFKIKIRRGGRAA